MNENNDGIKEDGKYYTPQRIVDIATGTGAFLKDAADYLIANPPYAAEHRVQRMGLLARILKWFGAIAHR